MKDVNDFELLRFRAAYLFVYRYSHMYHVDQSSS